MKTSQLLAAARTCQWLAQRLGELPAEKVRVERSHPHLVASAMHLVAYVHHLDVEGMEPYDALLATAKGDLQLPVGPWDEMDADRVESAIEACQWFGQRLGDLPEEQKSGVACYLQMMIAAMHLVEYAHHLVIDGMEPGDALLATANGQLVLPESPSLTTFKLLLPQRVRK